MNLITSETKLLAHIPNVLQAATGEKPLIARIAAFLSMAEQWVASTFTGDALFAQICSMPEDERMHFVTSHLVVAEALRRALPQLDVVMTPNGVAVVSTSNLAPASKPRTDRIAESLLAERDNCAAMLLRQLTLRMAWRGTEQSQFFGATLFPTIDIMDRRPLSREGRWYGYLELRPKIMDIESSIAEEWISPELMEALRRENLHGTLADNRQRVAEMIKIEVEYCLAGDALRCRRLADIVNIIRTSPEEFPEWHRSETARLFLPHVFRNRKGAAGYFF